MAFVNPTKIVPYFDLQTGMAVADFGAGDGLYAIAMAERVMPKGKVYAIDVQKEMLIRLKNSVDAKRLKNVEYIWGDLEIPGGTKLADGHMDFVLISNVLSLSKLQYSIAKEAHRVLKNGGQIAVIDWSVAIGALHQESLVKEEEAKKIFEQGGFVYERSFLAGDNHYGIIFKKL